MEEKKKTQALRTRRLQNIWLDSAGRENPRWQGKINYFVAYSGFNELSSGYNQGFKRHIGCRPGSGELRWGALSPGATEWIGQKPDSGLSRRARYAGRALLPLV